MRKLFVAILTKDAIQQHIAGFFETLPLAQTGLFECIRVQEAIQGGWTLDQIMGASNDLDLFSRISAQRRKV
jgi:hypothetical protein